MGERAGPVRAWDFFVSLQPHDFSKKRGRKTELCSSSSPCLKG
jgi:hypothetical protein